MKSETMIERLLEIYRTIFGCRLDQSSELPGEPGDFLSERVPWTGTGDIVSSCFTSNRKHKEVMSSVFSTYFKTRIGGGEVVGLEYAADANQTFSYSLKKFIPHMDNLLTQQIIEMLCLSQSIVIHNRNTCFRPEFAFIVNFSNGFTYLERDQYFVDGLEHGAEEIRQIISDFPSDLWMQIFYGLEISDQTWSDLVQEQAAWAQDGKRGPYGMPGIDDWSCQNSNLDLVNYVDVDSQIEKDNFNRQLLNWLEIEGS